LQERPRPPGLCWRNIDQGTLVALGNCEPTLLEAVFFQTPVRRNELTHIGHASSANCDTCKQTPRTPETHHWVTPPTHAKKLSDTSDSQHLQQVRRGHREAFVNAP